MGDSIDAIYEGGVLKPLVPLLLPDKARVTLTIDAERPANINITSGGSVGSTIEPLDEWERQLLGIARDCGVSLADSAVGSDGLYE